VKRLPKNYVGRNHETLGSDVLAILKAVSLPERTLGPDLARRLSAVRADEWYPIGLLLEAFEVMDAKLGDYGLHHVGWELFKLSHADAVRANVRSAHELLNGFDAIYKRVNRGEDIGGWNVLVLEPGHALLEKTTPHHCKMEEGLIEEAMRTLGIRVEVSQSRCFRKGADACHFVLRSPVTDERWTG
jgi:hypothetical protein